MTENLSNISHHTKIYLQEFPATGHHRLLIWKYSRTLLLLNYLLLREIFYHTGKHQSPMLERFDHGTATFWRRTQTNTDRHPHLHRMFQRVQHSLFQLPYKTLLAPIPTPLSLWLISGSISVLAPVRNSASHKIPPLLLTINRLDLEVMHLTYLQVVASYLIRG